MSTQSSSKTSFTSDAKFRLRSGLSLSVVTDKKKQQPNPKSQTNQTEPLKILQNSGFAHLDWKSKDDFMQTLSHPSLLLFFAIRSSVPYQHSLWGATQAHQDRTEPTCLFLSDLDLRQTCLLSKTWSFKPIIMRRVFTFLFLDKLQYKLLSLFPFSLLDNLFSSEVPSSTNSWLLCWWDTEGCLL